MTIPTLTKILHVEDDPDIQAVTRLALEKIGGFNVRTCSGGKEALAVAPEYATDLILMDVMMPGMDGPTTLQALRKMPKVDAVPVVFMTAKVQAAEIAQYKEMGAADVIVKPFNPMALAEEVKKIWAAVNRA